ncbi:hypothetical protein ACWEL8_09740 [Streptomyces sp. NPDC004690]
MPGSQASLSSLSAVVESASLAACDLATAVAENPLDAAHFAVHTPSDVEAASQSHHAAAVPRLAELLDEAAHLLGLSATGCHYIATFIVRDLKGHPEHLPPLPDLTRAQYTALEKIAEGGAEISRSLRGTRATIRAGDGSALHSKPFTVLVNTKLVHLQRAASPYAPWAVTVTTAGRLVLDTQKPSRPRMTPSAKATPAPADGAGRHR